MSSFKYITVILMLASALSCSVKEDRSLCLCCLGLDYSECDDERESLVLIGWDGGMSESFRSVPHAEGPGAYCEYYVPRCSFTLSASRGSDITDDNCVIADAGSQADSLYASADVFMTDSEYCYRKIQLSKQFATVRIITGNSFYLNDGILVSGNTVGLSLSDLSPVRGDFSCQADKLSDGVYSFRLFRYSGDVVVRISNREIDLSRMLDECGYDWAEKSLRDIDLYLDKAMTEVSVQISGWDYVQTIYLEI